MKNHKYYYEIFFFQLVRPSKALQGHYVEIFYVKWTYI